MKKQKFIGHLLGYEHLNCSYYGNPRYYGVFIDSEGNYLRGKTASNAACAYGFLNYIDKAREITYHETRTGNIIFDYIKVIED